MWREPIPFEVVLRIMRLLWEWPGDEPMPIEVICMRYVATYLESRGWRIVPVALKRMAREGIVKEFSTQSQSWWRRWLRWFFPSGRLLLNPPPPDPTARYQALFTEEQFRAELPAEWFEEE